MECLDRSTGTSAQDFGRCGSWLLRRSASSTRRRSCTTADAQGSAPLGGDQDFPSLVGASGRGCARRQDPRAFTAAAWWGRSRRAHRFSTRLICSGSSTSSSIFPNTLSAKPSEDQPRFFIGFGASNLLAYPSGQPAIESIVSSVICREYCGVCTENLNRGVVVMKSAQDGA